MRTPRPGRRPRRVGRRRRTARRRRREIETGETDAVRGFDSPVALEARRPAAPESQPVYSAETASETLAARRRRRRRGWRRRATGRRPAGKVGPGGGERARGARAEDGDGEGPTLGADGRHVVVVVVVVGGGDVFVVERRGVRVGRSGAGGEVPQTIWAARASLRAMDLPPRARTRRARRHRRGRRPRAHGRERTDRRARETWSAAASRGSLGEETGIPHRWIHRCRRHRRWWGSRPRSAEERLAVATDRVAHHREARGRLGRVSAHLCRRDRGRRRRLTFPPVSHVGTSRQVYWHSLVQQLSPQSELARLSALFLRI